MKYIVDKYKGRWAVFDTVACVWYFATEKGKRGAQKLADTLNKN